MIKSLHQNATSIVKWSNEQSEPFSVLQGIRQGALLSADLYKLYVNPLLDRLQSTNRGCIIGNIRCNGTASADDITINSQKEDDCQILIAIAEHFSTQERYFLQPNKTETLHVEPS